MATSPKRKRSAVLHDGLRNQTGISAARQAIGVSFRMRTLEASLLCSECFARDLLDAFSDGKLRPALDRTFAFACIAEAHAYMPSDG
jgi:NADPH:quinone reductase-like Zn-dependent oxidoreductase